MIKIVEIREEGEFMCNYPTIESAIADFDRIIKFETKSLRVLQVRNENGEVVKEHRSNAKNALTG